MDDADAHHLSRVLRLSDGETVCAADGAGAWRMCSIVSGTLVPLGEPQRLSVPSSTLTVGFAAPKGDRTEWAVRKLTEVGVDRIEVLRTERSVVRWNPDRAEKQLTRMQRWVRESSRQCRRLWLPELAVSSLEEHPIAALADSGGRRVSSADHAILVGPEGGWTTSEREGRDLVGLGEHVLRTETAAVLAGSALMQHRLWPE